MARAKQRGFAVTFNSIQLMAISIKSPAPEAVYFQVTISCLAFNSNVKKEKENLCKKDRPCVVSIKGELICIICASLFSADLLMLLLI